MLTAGDVVRAAIPNAATDVVEHVLFGRTPFPCGTVTARSLYRAASGYARATARDVRLCDHCERPASPPTSWMCEQCRAVLTTAKTDL